MRQGEIWWVRIPFTGGHEQAGERPALIVQSDAAIAALPTVLVVPFTSVLATLRFPGTLLIQPTPQNGLLVPSVALVFQMRVLDKRYCLRRMGERDMATLSQIWALLDNLLGR
jgi:mRNA interferase MazF